MLCNTHYPICWSINYFTGGIVFTIGDIMIPKIIYINYSTVKSPSMIINRIIISFATKYIIPLILLIQCKIPIDLMVLSVRINLCITTDFQLHINVLSSWYYDNMNCESHEERRTVAIIFQKQTHPLWCYLYCKHTYKSRNLKSSGHATAIKLKENIFYWSK